MSFLETADLAYAASFRARVKVGLVNCAGAVLQEDQDALSEAHADKRNTLAANVLRDPDSIVSAFIWPILANVSIAASGLDASDGDLLYQINAVWDNVAGVTRNDREVPAV